MKTITRNYITNILSKDNPPPSERIMAGEAVAFETYIGLEDEDTGMLLTLEGDLVICQTVTR